VVRKSEQGWVVGNEEATDLTSAMVLADLLAADLASAGPTVAAPVAMAPTPPPPAPDTGDETERLAATVTQLEHALTVRVRVEQAIGVLAERHRLRPRQAFDLLRSAARARGIRVSKISEDVVASAANPLLILPEELARTQVPRRHRVRSPRRARAAD
jgi:hypothetical protein